MSWLLTACHHLGRASDGTVTCWAVDCLAPGCLWTTTTDTPDQADDAAIDHRARDHELEDE